MESFTLRDLIYLWKEGLYACPRGNAVRIGWRDLEGRTLQSWYDIGSILTERAVLSERVQSTPADDQQSGQEHLETWTENPIWKNSGKCLGTVENWQGFELANLIELFFQCLGSTNCDEFAKHLFL